MQQHLTNVSVRFSLVTRHSHSWCGGSISVEVSTLLTTLWWNGDSLPSKVHLLKKGNVKPVKRSFNEEGLIIV